MPSMPRGRLFTERAVRPERALAAGASLTTLLSAEQPLAMYAATLQGEAIVLGHHQRASQALAQDTPNQLAPLRRRSGGSTVLAGDGISYVALALHDRSALMTCPPQRLLNRNVRGALQGLRLTGVAANYFGRDFLSFEARPAVYVGWDADEQDHVLLEFFISDERSCWPQANLIGYPPRKEDVLRGRAPTTLLEANAHVHGLEALEKVAEGHALAFHVDWQREAPESLRAADLTADAARESPAQLALQWSRPCEEAIGFVSAGVALDGSGKFAAVSLAGDFFAHRACAAALERMLLGVSPNAEMVARAVDAAYAHPAHDFEGVRNLRVLQEAILDAADSARRAHEG
jgi:hypothetical protein